MSSQTASFLIPPPTTRVSDEYDTFSYADDSEIYVYDAKKIRKNMPCFNVNIAEYFNVNDPGWYAWTDDNRVENIDNGEVIRLVYKIGESHTSLCRRLTNVNENRYAPFNIVCLMKGINNITEEHAKLVESAIFKEILTYEGVTKTQIPSATRTGEFFICSSAEINRGAKKSHS